MAGNKVARGSLREGSAVVVLSALYKGECVGGNLYEGRKTELIREGICKPEWFPVSPVYYGRGRIKRRFNVKTRFGDARLVDQKDGSWLISVPASKEELARREERREAERRREQEKAERKHERQREAEKREREFLKAALPPFTGEPSDVEIEHLRILRALPVNLWTTIVRMVEDLVDLATIPDEPVQKRAHLQLVVNNE